MAFYDDLSKLLELYHTALRGLGKPIDEADVERKAFFIASAMSNPSRYFHRSHHIIELCHRASPLETLAILYHDVVYYHIDEDFPPLCDSAVSKSVEDISAQEAKTSDFAQSRPPFDIVPAIFGVAPGSILTPTTGMNEYLSAIAAVAHLHGLLSPIELVTVVTCIELTIPFRTNQPGSPVTTSLCRRVEQWLQACGQDPKQGITAVAAGVRVANRDVGNFAYAEVADFITNTWLVMRENYPALRCESVTIYEVRLALQSMANFLRDLHGRRVFTTAYKVPSAKEYHALVKNAERNLDIARVYLAASIYGIALMEAIARESGGDIPYFYWVGHNHVRSTYKLHSSCIPEIVELLEMAHSSMIVAPIAALVYREMGARIESLATAAQRLFFAELSPAQFLKEQNRKLVAICISDFANAAPSRVKPLSALSAKLKL